MVDRLKQTRPRTVALQPTQARKCCWRSCSRWDFSWQLPKRWSRFKVVHTCADPRTPVECPGIIKCVDKSSKNLGDKVSNTLCPWTRSSISVSVCFATWSYSLSTSGSEKSLLAGLAPCVLYYLQADDRKASLPLTPLSNESISDHALRANPTSAFAVACSSYGPPAIGVQGVHKHLIWNICMSCISRGFLWDFMRLMRFCAVLILFDVPVYFRRSQDLSNTMRSCSRTATSWWVIWRFFPVPVACANFSLFSSKCTNHNCRCFHPRCVSTYCCLGLHFQPIIVGIP